MEGKVKVRNMIDCEVTVSLPQLRFSRSWPKKDAVISVDYSILEEAIFDPGVANMLSQGILYIEDMDAKKALGLEPEEAEEPQNIIILKDGQILRLLRVVSQEEFEETLATLPYEQVNNMCNYAIEHEMLDIPVAKMELLKKRTGIDVLKSVLLNRAAE